LDKIEKKEKKLCTKENVLDEIENNLPEIIVTLGAGDIDRLVEPIVNMLNKRINTQDHEN
jgi:UDP-N-acetylmuramate--alanine ligase